MSDIMIKHGISFEHVTAQRYNKLRVNCSSNNLLECSKHQKCVFQIFSVLSWRFNSTILTTLLRVTSFLGNVIGITSI